jgi:hypothetical protein
VNTRISHSIVSLLTGVFLSGCGGTIGKSNVQTADFKLPDHFTKNEWSACFRKGHHHVAENARFKIEQIENNSGLYGLRLLSGPDWEPGWTGLTLAVVGSQPDDITPKEWNHLGDCELGKELNGDPDEFMPLRDTVRLRGGVCLPYGIPNHVAGTCNIDTTDKRHYHEVVVFTRSKREQVDDTDHLILQHCSRGELRDNEAKGNWQCPYEEDKDPHPGHVHGDP